MFWSGQNIISGNHRNLVLQLQYINLNIVFVGCLMHTWSTSSDKLNKFRMFFIIFLDIWCNVLQRCNFQNYMSSWGWDLVTNWAKNYQQIFLHYDITTTVTQTTTNNCYQNNIIYTVLHYNKNAKTVQHYHVRGYCSAHNLKLYTVYCMPGEVLSWISWERYKQTGVSDFSSGTIIN